MPGPIAAAAGGVLIEKVSDEDSIVNTAFKFTLLIGLAIAIGLGIFLIYKLTSIFDGTIAAVTDTGSDLFLVGGVSPVGVLINGVLSSTLFGRALIVRNVLK